MTTEDSNLLKCQFCDKGFESTYSIIPHIYFNHPKKICRVLKRDGELLLKCPVTSCEFQVVVPDVDRSLESTWTEANLEKLVRIKFSKMLKKIEDHLLTSLLTEHTHEEKLTQCPYCQEDLAGQIYWIHLEKHLDGRWITKSRRKRKAGSEEERNVSPYLGTDGPARQEKSPRTPVIKLPDLVEDTEGKIVEDTGGKNVEPILEADRTCSARQEKSPRESPTTLQSHVEDAGDGRVEDLELRDDDGCGLTIMSVESVIRTPSPVPSISRPSVIKVNPSPRTTAVRKMTRRLQDRSSPIIRPPRRVESEKEPVVITIDDDDEDQEVEKEPIVTAKNGEEEEETPAKKHKLCRDLPPSISVIHVVTL